MLLENLQNSQENLCARVSFLIKLQAEARNFIKKETQAQVFSREFCEISKNTLFTEHLWATASDLKLLEEALSWHPNLSFDWLRTDYEKYIHGKSEKFLRNPKRVLLYDPQKHHLESFPSHL